MINRSSEDMIRSWIFQCSHNDEAWKTAECIASIAMPPHGATVVRLVRMFCRRIYCI